MTAATDTPTYPPAPAHLRVGFGLGYAVLGAPAAWALQLLINFALASHACYPNDIPLAQPIWGFLWWVLIGVDLIAIIAAGTAGFLALANWRTWRDADRRIVGQRRNRFLSQWAMLTTTLFSIAIIFTIVMVFILPICDV